MRDSIDFTTDIHPTFAPRMTRLVDILGRVLPKGWSAEAFESYDHQQSLVVMGDDEASTESYTVALSSTGYELFVVSEHATCEQVAPLTLKQVVAAICARIATPKAPWARAA